MSWHTDDPTFEGAAGKAWECLQTQLDALTAFAGRMDDWGASLAQWLFHAEPPQHPAWSWYMISLCHLRPIEGTPAPTLHFPAATHEFMVCALEPATNNSPPTAGALKVMLPLNVEWQIACVEDDDAVELATVIVKNGIVNGTLPIESFGGSSICTRPNRDFPECGLWRDAVAQTLEHIVTGGHS